MTTQEKPSFARYLRTVGSLGLPVPKIDIEELFERRRRWKKSTQKTVTWQKVKDIYSRNFRASTAVIGKMLLPLRAAAREAVGDEAPQGLLDDATVTLLTLLLGEKMLTRGLTEKLVATFGTLEPGVASRAFEAVQGLSANLSEEQIQNIRSACSTNDSDMLDNKENIPQFGADIVVAPQEPWEPPDVSMLDDMLGHSKVSSVVDNFSMDYNAFSAPKDTSRRKNQYGVAWLRDKVEMWCDQEGGMTAEEMCESLSTLLQGPQDNDQLQDGLFNMLGFERVELIQELLQHRKDFVKEVLAGETYDKKKQVRQGAMPALRTLQPGCQVVVQRSDEVELVKQLRRDEKKAQRVAAREAKDAMTDSEEEEEFDAAKLRAKRLEQLASAQRKPLFGPRKSVLPRRQEVEHYPHVYDSQLTAKHAAGYVANRRMMLPEGVDRKDTKLWEEVNIPLAQQGPLAIGEERIRIQDLDELAQMAFKGIDCLNRIQTVVFETAYHTNENLLICAPTGAGKTNVALLTMLHTIRDFASNGINHIQHQEFKIIYVAPMKALAAEMANSFSKRLKPLGLTVRELTGDMQMTKNEIKETQVIVTTPEKWDVVTRKGTGDVALTQIVRLLIIDEVHLLHGDRGPVVEAIVARTLRLVESKQNMIRIVGLSATLPNYIDVAHFLNVNPYVGLFFFDSRFRPVPLSMSFVGVKATKNLQQMSDMDDVCFDKVLEQVQKGYQVMVFVHARNATVRTANMLADKAQQEGVLESFQPKQSMQLSSARRSLEKSPNKSLGELFNKGFAVHHAGMLRTDRNLVERHFADGLVSVLVCTSTLAWGVNLPAHAVIIRGTEIYDAQRGSFVDLGILDVLQIFGRAGRPQFEKSGHGVIITSHDKLSHYLQLLTNQYPIESNFLSCVADNLNAEIVLGTISNIDEAVQWMSYSYLYIRMRKNPQHYGLTYASVQEDPQLLTRRRKDIQAAAMLLDNARMVRFVQRTGDLFPTDIGRTASYFYIKYDTVQIFNEQLQPKNIENNVVLNDAQIIALISQAQEFNQLKVRDDEQDEMDKLMDDYCEVTVAGGPENLHGKVNILIQTFLSRGRTTCFSLSSDMSFITQNAVRIARALFDIVLKQNNSLLAGRLLNIAKMLQLQMWDFHHPLLQFPNLGTDLISKLESKRRLSIEVLREMKADEIGAFIRHTRKGAEIKTAAWEFPLVEVTSSIQPITRSILKINITIVANFRWNDRVHGKTAETFWLWIEDTDTNRMYHHENILITKRQVMNREKQELVATIPIHEPMPSQYMVRVINDRWLGSETSHCLGFEHLILPEEYPPHTDLLCLEPLRISALNDSRLESLYSFPNFNPIQTQVFHCMYHTDDNVVLGAPTGSGKTLVAELAMFRVFRDQPGAKVVYIAPMKALVRERVQDWGKRLGEKLKCKVIELTGDATPDVRAIEASDVVVTTPEKWDGVSRSWQTRGYVRQVALLIIDEIHLLGEDRGPVLEVIVSRANYIASHAAGTGARKCRVVGLSTALANAGDLAAWLNISPGCRGMYNFKPSVRPVPVDIHIQGFPGKHYCPRMATMNKPTFLAIRHHSPGRPALVFVSSRRQTRLTALDLVAFLAAEEDPKQWLHMSEEEAASAAAATTDTNLKLLLPFGIGIHHAGLQDKDRSIVESLFLSEKIQVLIATATLAWGVNFPAHLVVVKGTEFFDGKTHRYVDMPITDVLQMIGRAGRPQFDDSAVAVVLVQDTKKNFYKRFLHEPFPVESNLLQVLPDHLNAEVVAGVISTKQEALEYLTWTYFFRRLLKNPSYYGLESIESMDVNKFLSNLVQNTVNDLVNSRCMQEDEDNRGLLSTSLGRIASYYYLSHKTMAMFDVRLKAHSSMEELLRLLSDATEYEELPVRHNEDEVNRELAKKCRFEVSEQTLDSPHTKAFLLFQAHMSRLQLPSSDYYTDLKSVLDQAIRILQAMIDVCAEQGFLQTILHVQVLLQSIVQAAWFNDPSTITLPHVEKELAEKLRDVLTSKLPELQKIARHKPQMISGMLQSNFNKKQIDEVMDMVRGLPCPTFHMYIDGWWEGASKSESRRIPQPPPNNQDPYIQLHADQEYVLRLRPVNKIHVGNAFAPRFPRIKDAGWFVMLGIVDSGSELLVMKRVAASNRAITLAFTTPPNVGRAVIYLYLMSNCYMGIDQQYELHIEVIESSIEAQFNTEVTY